MRKEPFKYTPELIKELDEYLQTHSRAEAIEKFGLKEHQVQYAVDKYRNLKSAGKHKPGRSLFDATSMVTIPLHNDEKITICKSCLKAFMELSK